MQLVDGILEICQHDLRIPSDGLISCIGVSSRVQVLCEGVPPRQNRTAYHDTSGRCGGSGVRSMSLSLQFHPK